MNTKEIKTNGITLFTLKSNFSEDETKGCSLLGKEVDSNFLFLRNNDIYGGEIKNNGTTLILHKGGENNDIVVTGFTSFIDNKTVLTQQSLIGDGSNNHPLGVSKLYETSHLLPAKTFIDKTNGDNIDMSQIKKGDIVITKEFINDYGKLYNFNAVKKIDEILKQNSSIWRVPTNEEWGQMLNAIEICDTDKTHVSNISGYYGKFAGAYLKSNSNDWLENEKTINSYDFNALPSGIKKNENDTKTYFRELTRFWSITPNAVGEVWARQLEYNLNTVELISANKNGYYSLRLIADYTENYNTIQEILGDNYNIIKLPFIELNENGVEINRGYKLWTAVNISYSSNIPYNSYISVTNENNEVIDGNVKYYVNNWDGKNWLKRELFENAIISIIDRDNKEFKFLNGELVENSTNNSGFDNEELDNIKKEIKQITATTENLSSDIVLLKEKDTKLSKDIYDESQIRKTEISDIQTLISNETLKRENDISTLNSEINSCKTNISGITDSLENETNALISAIDVLNENISNETKERKDVVSKLNEKINTLENTIIKLINILGVKDIENVENTHAVTEIIAGGGEEISVNRDKENPNKIIIDFNSEILGNITNI